MSESCFKLIHFNRVRGVQHSPKHSLPTGPHKMVMRTLLSADNEIDAANTDALAADRDWLLISLFEKRCTLEKENRLGKCIYDSLTLSLWLSGYNRNTVHSELSSFFC